MQSLKKRFSFKLSLVALLVTVLGALVLVSHSGTARADHVDGDENNACSPHAVVYGVLSRISNNDLPGAVSLLDPNVEYVNVGLARVTSAGGAQAFLSPLVSLFSAINLVDPATLVIMHEGPLVNVERIEHYTVSPASGLPTAGTTFDLHVSGNFTVKHCKVTRWVDYFDRDEFNRGSGLGLPANPTAYSTPKP
jgi:limonene-1,2-epoxide hydrolase